MVTSALSSVAHHQWSTNCARTHSFLFPSSPSSLLPSVVINSQLCADQGIKLKHLFSHGTHSLVVNKIAGEKEKWANQRCVMWPVLRLRGWAHAVLVVTVRIWRDSLLPPLCIIRAYSEVLMEKMTFTLEFEGWLGLLQGIEGWKEIPGRRNNMCRGRKASRVEDAWASCVLLEGRAAVRVEGWI